MAWFEKYKKNKGDQAHAMNELALQIKATSDQLKESAEKLKQLSDFIDQMHEGGAAPDGGDKIASLEAELSARASEIERYKSRIGELESQLAAKDNAIISLEKEIKSVKNFAEGQSRDLDLHKNDLEKLRRDLKDREGEIKGYVGKIEGLEDRIAAKNEQIADIDHKFQLANAKIEEKDRALAFQAAEMKKYSGLPGIDELRQIHATIAAIPAQFLGLVQDYYNVDNLPVFLSQCGQFDLLAQIWRACHDLARDGKDPQNIGQFLALALMCYNNASPHNMGREIRPEIGGWYDAATQERLGPQGDSKIERVILPGLARPNGVIAAKALVLLA